MSVEPLTPAEIAQYQQDIDEWPKPPLWLPYTIQTMQRALATITSQGKRIAFLEAQMDSLPTTVEYDDQRAEMETLRAALRDLWDYTGRDQYYYDPEHKAQLARLLPGLLDHTGVPVSPAEPGGGEG